MVPEHSLSAQVLPLPVLAQVLVHVQDVGVGDAHHRRSWMRD